MEENTELKIKLEIEISNLKKEYKRVNESLLKIKYDFSSILSTKERLIQEIDDGNNKLNIVLNDISNAKLAWISEKENQLLELDRKNKEVDKILSRKSELDLQEENTKILNEDTKKIINENRQLELKIKKDVVNLDVKIRDIEEKEKILENENLKLEKRKKDFGNKLLELVKSYN